jgi:hypothetical protein
MNEMPAAYNVGSRQPSGLSDWGLHSASPKVSVETVIAENKLFT